ncbi:MAG TPA: bifunctional phosphoribosylaminoimidazolecarboxamide formyltransferase/IMP cyclohydrolase [Oligoflexia bacterium]|nr:bifunctional phosphoribosylaminoimidazolecarboxamide formyltransferase/IMP cyclohydrolase [Oligoflexia bacterium]HMR24798.1 bifunctional phosphoribosylaminoimidazolecarboxamide formyltransferase/IMP cyclohydrolase [Oligoflexia bacterium]
MQKTSKKRALISVTDKSNLDKLCAVLKKFDYEIYSSGGTRKHIESLGFEAIEVSQYTDFPEIMSGRVKTLHPKIHGGLLALREDQTHMSQANQHGILMFDLLIVNLYAFEQHARNPDLNPNQVIEHIDIGGPSMLRSAAKNFKHVCVLPDVSYYDQFIAHLQDNNGQTTLEFRQIMSGQTFALTQRYDQAISNYFQSILPSSPNENNTDKPSLYLNLQSKYDLRYGENPHQSAGFYTNNSVKNSILEQDIPGKQLSYNNILDLHAALKLIADFQGQTACAIFKHNNPCGLGISNSNSVLEAYEKALSGDPVSAFGGIVVFSKTLDKATTELMLKTFTELVVAPDFSPQAEDLLKNKKNLRYLRYSSEHLNALLQQSNIRSALDGFLIQDQDLKSFEAKTNQCVSHNKPTEEQLKALELAWKAVKHIKSNAIVICNESQILGVGAGQTSRVDSCHIAMNNAKQCKANKDVLVAASDAFFPFKDGVETLAKMGIQSIIQPGGSIRDQEVIDTVNELNMSMLLTGTRHFYH